MKVQIVSCTLPVFSSKVKLLCCVRVPFSKVSIREFDMFLVGKGDMQDYRNAHEHFD